MKPLQKNYEEVVALATAAAIRAGRTPGDIKIVAVSKTKPVEMMIELDAGGQKIFGENYVQEAATKRERLGSGAELHLIGHLQRNKARQAVQIFDCIQSIDSERLAEEISKEAVRAGKIMPVLVQVNISAEDSKSGASYAQAIGLCRRVSDLPGLELRGLMSIGSFVAVTASDEERRTEFKQMAALLADVNRELGLSLRELSMGMSHDYELAIEEGATIVRIGSQIFGARE